MDQIRAFVGHSFFKEDADVVRKFLDYFAGLSRLHPTFSWEHAEAAEPKLLTEKVMSIIADKNVFIGICTRRERVITPEMLSTSWLQSGYLKAPEAGFAWKTSDWIIQEIGLAIARSMHLILLVEDEVRDPGGLQGSVEYISFERGAPEKSFVKIVEMLTALSPKPPATSVAPPEVKSSEGSGQKEPQPPGDADWTKPSPDWNRDAYERAMFFMIIREDVKGADVINQTYLATADAGQGYHKATWNAYVEYTRLLYGQGGDFDKLKRWADEYPGSSHIVEFLAAIYAKYDDHPTAAGKYEEAAKVASNADRRHRLLGLSALEHFRTGKPFRAAEVVEKIRTEVKSGEGTELVLLQALRDLAGDGKDEDAALAAMERTIEITPDDSGMRFSLAYKHSEAGNNDLALYHYLKIPYPKRNAMTWNNLGVAYDEFKLPANAVYAYRKSEQMGETLAMSNLGNKLLSAGFTAEAQTLCDKALAVKEYHKNIGHLVIRLKGVSETEDQKEAAIIEKTKSKSEFYRSFGRAISAVKPPQYPKHWQASECVLTVAVTGDRILLSGSYERGMSALGNALLGGAPASVKSVTRNHVAFDGKINGRTIVATVSRTRDGEESAATSLLSAVDNQTKVLMYLSEDGSEIKAMENPHGANPNYYTLRLVEGAM